MFDFTDPKERDRLREDFKYHSTDDMIREFHAALDLIERQERELAILRRLPKSGVWYWQGDGDDLPASLECPVIMEPGVLREMLTTISRFREDYQLLNEAENKIVTDEITRLRAALSDIANAEAGTGSPDEVCDHPECYQCEEIQEIARLALQAALTPEEESERTRLRAQSQARIDAGETWPEYEGDAP